MIPPNQWFDDFQKNMSELLAKTPAADIERTMKTFMTQTFARMDLITREEFDVQAELLARALKRVDALEARIQALEDPVDKPE
ncbi:MAG: accessory factor UbiK family protein [Castellaniella sp.]|uniref:accessory factor UbiK family protein n=1 Tax=Castellaniella sp. TaxID=1955812 RepID=UPI00121122D5|nr:accessory factor UbiK family protein [Castellaniella sp.]TAN29266.1 MAG: accessory factor UbiK family protein [Castellaniella sp.]